MNIDRFNQTSHIVEVLIESIFIEFCLDFLLNQAVNFVYVVNIIRINPDYSDNVEEISPLVVEVRVSKYGLIDVVK